MTSWKTNIDMSHENQLGRGISCWKPRPIFRGYVACSFFFGGVELQAATIRYPKLSKPKIQHWIRLKIAEENSDDIITPWSKYMAQSPKGRLIQGLHKPIQGNCAIYFYPGVWRFGSDHFPFFSWVICRFQPLIFQGFRNMEYLYVRFIFLYKVCICNPNSKSWVLSALLKMPPTKIGVATKPCTCSAQVICSGQIIATENTTDLPPNGGLVEKSPYFRET